MTLLEAIFLGLVQGLTEFLPISSTAHIVMARMFLGIDAPGLFLEIWLHMGSLAAVTLYYRNTLWNLAVGGFAFVFKRDASRKIDFFWIIYLGIGTFITGVLGLTLKESIDEHITSPQVMGFSLLFTALLLLAVEQYQKMKQPQGEVNLWRSIFIGFMQAIAILPGVSRSGITLVGGLASGLKREEAVRFSFLLAIPVVAGSSLVAFKDVSETGDLLTGFPLTALLLAVLTSAFASWIGIIWLIRFVQSGRLYIFAIYCAVVGSVLVFYVR